MCRLLGLRGHLGSSARANKTGGGKINRRRLRGILAFLAIMGPGIITSLADDDAGGIATYSLCGASYGYKLLSLVVFIILPLAIVQEMCARMGAVTQKGLAELIREEYGVVWVFFALAVMFVANTATTAAEYAGIGASGEIFGISAYITVPLTAILMWFAVVKGSFRTVERVFLGLTLVFITYIIAGFKVPVNWHAVAKNTFIPGFSLQSGFILLVIATIGTTITPWMQFFLQSTVVDKGIAIKEYRYSKLEVIIGAFFTETVAFFIVIATAGTLFLHHVPIPANPDPALFARALEPVAGRFAEGLFSVGLFSASLLASAVLPISTAYAFCEAFGWELGMSKTWREAPIFFGIYTASMIIGVLTILFAPKGALVPIMLISQDINGILLPVVLIFMLKLINNKRIMGEYVNNRIYNTIAWVTAIGVILLTLALVVTSIFPIHL